MSDELEDNFLKSNYMQLNKNAIFLNLFIFYNSTIALILDELIHKYTTLLVKIRKKIKFILGNCLVIIKEENQKTVHMRGKCTNTFEMTLLKIDKRGKNTSV